MPQSRSPDRRCRILVVEDNAAARTGVMAFLEAVGYAVDGAGDCALAEATFTASAPDATILDERLPDGSGLDLLARLRALDPAAAVVMLTGHASIDLAVRAIKLGAEHFLAKPVDLQALELILRRMLDSRRDRRKRLASERPREAGPSDPFFGSSSATRRLRDEVEPILETDLPVLLLGETGTGKGVLARFIHDKGPRCEEAFVDVNCASLARELLESELFGHEPGAFTGAVRRKAGLLEVANRGTLFLDEVGDMDQAIQPRLLKVLEEQRFRRVGDVRDTHVDVRLIAATHQDLRALIGKGQFREDLYFRLSTMPVVVPPLRERREDIPGLARLFVEAFSRRVGRMDVAMAPDTLGALQDYSWPGNVRELRHVLERAVLLCRGASISAGDLRLETPSPPEAAPPRAGGDDADQTLSAIERRHIARVLKDTGGRVRPAAERLGISPSSLYDRIRRLQIPASGF